MNSIGRVIFVSFDKLTFEVSDFEKLKYNSNGYSYLAKGVVDYVTIINEGNQKFIYQVIKTEDKEQILSKEESSKLDYIGRFDCIPVGIIKNNKIEFNLENYPFLNNKVYLTTEEEKKVLFSIDNSKRSLVLGYIEEKYQGKISISKLFNHHGAVLGNTGSGKSNTVRQIVSETQKHETENLYIHILDVHEEYGQLVDEEDRIDVLSNFKIKISSLELQDWVNLVKPSDLVQLPILQTALKLSSVLSKNLVSETWLKCFLAYTMYNEVQTDVLGKRTKILNILNGVTVAHKDKYSAQYGNFGSFEQQFLDSLIALMKEKGQNHIDLSFLQGRIEEADYKVTSFPNLLKSLDYAFLLEETKGNSQVRSYCATLETRIKNIQSRYSQLLTENVEEKNKDNHQVTVYDVSKLDDDLLLFFSSYLLKNTFNRCKSLKQPDEKEINVFILEEAHRYISKEKENSAFLELELFKKISREGRKFGCFLFLSSQRPSELSSTVLSQCNNYLIHRIKNNLDLDFILRTIPYIDSNQLKRVSYLPTGRILAVGELFPIPIEIQVIDRKDEEVSMTPEIKYKQTFQ